MTDAALFARFALTILLVGANAAPQTPLGAPTDGAHFARAVMTRADAAASSTDAAQPSFADATLNAARAGVNQFLTRGALAFEANAGQAPAAVKFLARGAGYSLWLTSDEAILTWSDAAREKRTETTTPSLPNAKRAADSPFAVGHASSIRLHLVGAGRAARVAGEDELPGKGNYFTGNDPSKWRVGVTNYARVRYAEVYPGVDMVYYGTRQQLEYDFIIAPKADAARIKMRFDGARKLSIDEQGDLLIATEAGVVRQHKPFAYQETNGEKRAIEVSYVLHGKREVGFEIGNYDHAKPLVIDPMLVYSDAIGGNGFVRGDAIAVDAAGNVYIAGETSATNFPVVNSFQKTYGGNFADAFVLKLNPSGTAFVYATYLGGSNTDVAGGIAVDSQGNAYITGITASPNFPTANAFQSAKAGSGFESFVTKLNATGNALVYSTFFHGSDNSDIRANAIAVDSAGSAYIAGLTLSKSLPVLNGAQTTFGGGFGDAFLTKFAPAGNALAYSTYLGGSDFDQAFAVALDASGNAYITGHTLSTNFPTANPFQATKGGSSNNFNAFVTKVNTNASGAASLVYSTYLGGQFSDFGNGIAVDSSGSAYVTGIAGSDNFPTTTGALKTSGFSNAFVTKFAPAGNTLAYSTYLGGGVDSATQGNAIAVDSQGDAYIIGTTAAPDFPLKNALQTKGGGGFFRSANAAAAWSVQNSGLPDGNTTSILVDPTNPSLVYQSNRANGGNKSGDGGGSWSPLNIGTPVIDALAFDPTNSATIYAVGDGVNKTTNGGASWTRLGGGLPANKEFTAFVASSATNLYAGTSDGKVFRSADGGATWTDFSNGLPTNGLRIQTLAAAPTSPATIYAGIRASFDFGGANGVYKIADNQTTWTAANTGLSNSSSSGAQYINAIVVDPSNPNTIYVATNGDLNVQNGGIYKSVNGGGNWTPLVRTQFNNLSLAVDPTNPSNIYVGTESASGIGILKSVDGGATWTASGLTSDQIIALAISRAAPSTIYAGVQGGADQFVSVLNPTGSALLFSTYYGGTGAEAGRGIALDSNDNVYVTGATASNDFPKTPNTPSNAELFGRLKDTIPNQTPDDLEFGKLGDILTSNNCPPITVSQTDSNTSAQVGNLFVTRFQAKGGASPYKFGISSGSLPPGVQINSEQTSSDTALLTGVPTAAGTYKFTITATDANGCRGSFDATITVDCPPIEVIEASFGRDGNPQNPRKGDDYSGLAVASGGAEPYTFTITGNLPPGLKTKALTRLSVLVIYGHITAAGTYIFTITATDKYGCTGNVSVTINVADAPLAIDTVKPNAGREQDKVLIMLNGTIANSDLKSADVNGTPANAKVIQIPQPPPAKDGAPSPVSPAASNTLIQLTVPQGAATGPIHLNLTQGTLTSPLPFYVTKLPNAIDDPPFYVTQHYRDFLNREPDSAGLNFWVNQITSCNGDATCIDIKRQNVSAAYFLSREFQETGFFVITMNRAAFGRVSNDAAKRMDYQEFLFFAQQVGKGFIDGQAGADAVLDANKTAYAQSVAANPVFAQLYPTTLSASRYVDALFATAGVAPTAQERQDAINAFGSGDTNGRAASLRKVAESASVKTAEFRAAFVLLQYFGYLRRNPTDPPDNNDAGYQFWLTKLNNFNGDYIKSEMVRSFIVSTEYRNRFAPLSSQ